MATRLQEKYNKEIRPALVKEFDYQNEMMIPKLKKIVISAGVGEAVADKKKLDSVVREIELIAGQKVMKTAAKKSIAGFKLREEMLIGAKVTLRKDRMFEFLDRLINVAMPRIRDFRGINGDAFDGNGNYSMGIKEQLIFPEIDYDQIDQIRGMNICFVTSAPTNAEAKALLKAFNMPFAN